MTTRTDALELLAAELERRSSSPAGRRAVRRFARAGVDVGKAISLADLVRRYHEGSIARDPSAKAMLEDLLALAPTDEDAALCALDALRPGLCWVVRRVYGTRGATEDELAEILAFAWEAICHPASKPRSRAKHVVFLARTRARTAERRRRAAALDECDHPGDEGSDTAMPDPGDRPEPLLERAVRAGVLSRAEAKLIALTRGLGIPAKALARDDDVSTKTLLQRRKRAEERLRRALQTDFRSQ